MKLLVGTIGKIVKKNGHQWSGNVDLEEKLETKARCYGNEVFTKCLWGDQEGRATHLRVVLHVTYIKTVFIERHSTRDTIELSGFFREL